jgi:nucleoside-diphosphate-sugar epimerase
MKYYLIGSKGRLGRAIAKEFAGDAICSLHREIYDQWSQQGAADLVSRYFEQCSKEEATVFVASGLLDPRLPEDELFRVNYILPKNVIDGATKHGVNVITFGTVMEGLLQSKNLYIQSKSALGEYSNAVAEEACLATHIQLHTLYGQGCPSPFMFLGQMLAAIQANQDFEMTSGDQLREYHHLADEAVAIRAIVDSVTLGPVNLSHGKPISLKAIAEGVFDMFEKRHLLRLGAIPNPPDENYDKIMPPIEILEEVFFRDSLPAIIEYMQACYSPEEITA